MTSLRLADRFQLEAGAEARLIRWSAIQFRVLLPLFMALGLVR